MQLRGVIPANILAGLDRDERPSALAVAVEHEAQRQALVDAGDLSLAGA